MSYFLCVFGPHNFVFFYEGVDKRSLNIHYFKAEILGKQYEYTDPYCFYLGLG